MNEQLENNTDKNGTGNVTPKYIHFIYLANGDSEFPIIYYVAVKSAKIKNPTYHVIVHSDAQPTGVFWELLKDLVTLRRILVSDTVYGTKIDRVQHKVDVLRLQILLEMGGVYLDLDTITIRPLDKFLSDRVVMGKESADGLCNAVLFSPRAAKFLTYWLDNYRNFHNRQWNEFSVLFPMKLSKTWPDLIHIEPKETFFWPDFTDTSLEDLFVRSKEFPDAYVIHLWQWRARNHIAKIDISSIFANDTTYNLLARQVIGADRQRILGSPPASDSFFRNDFVSQYFTTKPRKLGTFLDDKRLPLVFVAVFLRDTEPSLNLYLECLERQTYPKVGIVLYIRTNSNSNETIDIMRRWLKRVWHEYNRVVIDDSDVADIAPHAEHEWASDRQQTLGEMRNESIRACQRFRCDFYFTSDLESFLISTTLHELVSLNLPIVAPLIRGDRENGLWANFFSDINPHGYFVHTPRYNAILSRAVTGIIEVPLVQGAYLIRSDCLHQVSYTSPGGGYEFMIFAASARESGLVQYVDNRQMYGYAFSVRKDDPNAEAIIQKYRRMLHPPT